MKVTRSVAVFVSVCTLLFAGCQPGPGQLASAPLDVAWSVNRSGTTVGGDIWYNISTGERRVIPLPPGYKKMYMVGVSNSGVAVGFATGTGAPNGQAFVYDPVARSVSAVPLPAGTTESTATGVNDDGWVIGNSYATLGDPHPYLYNTRSRKLVDFGTWAGKFDPVAINAKGDIIGTTLSDGGSAGIELVNAQTLAVQHLIVPHSQNEQVQPFGISDNGTILGAINVCPDSGSGTVQCDQQPFILSPNGTVERLSINFHRGAAAITDDGRVLIQSSGLIYDLYTRQVTNLGTLAEWEATDLEDVNEDGLAVGIATRNSTDTLAVSYQLQNEPRNPIIRLYLASFLREPDVGGLVYWIGRAEAGVPLEQVASLFVGSAEFNSMYGNLDNARFISQLYLNVLKRAPDSGGQNYWNDQLSNGLSRGSLMLAFSNSSEFRTLSGIR